MNHIMIFIRLWTLYIILPYKYNVGLAQAVFLVLCLMFHHVFGYTKQGFIHNFFCWRGKQWISVKHIDLCGYGYTYMYANILKFRHSYDASGAPEGLMSLFLKVPVMTVIIELQDFLWLGGTCCEIPEHSPLYETLPIRQLCFDCYYPSAFRGLFKIVFANPLFTVLVCFKLTAACSLTTRLINVRQY